MWPVIATMDTHRTDGFVISDFAPFVRAEMAAAIDNPPLIASIREQTARLSRQTCPLILDDDGAWAVTRTLGTALRTNSEPQVQAPFWPIEVDPRKSTASRRGAALGGHHIWTRRPSPESP